MAVTSSQLCPTADCKPRSLLPSVTQAHPFLVVAGSDPGTDMGGWEPGSGLEIFFPIIPFFVGDSFPLCHALPRPKLDSSGCSHVIFLPSLQFLLKEEITVESRKKKRRRQRSRGGKGDSLLSSGAWLYWGTAQASQHDLVASCHCANTHASAWTGATCLLRKKIGKAPHGADVTAGL